MIYTDYAINLIERNQIWKECMEEDKELTGSGRLGRKRGDGVVDGVRISTFGDVAGGGG
jgi:hypothetical protein